jgi:hypothetical protein
MRQSSLRSKKPPEGGFLNSILMVDQAAINPSYSMARPCCSMPKASPISTPCTAATAMPRCSFMPSTVWPPTATTSASYRCRCARPIWRGSWPADRRHPRGAVRAGRDRARRVRRHMPHGAGGPGLQAPPSALSPRPLRRLDQGQEPEASGVQAGDGYVRVTGVFARLTARDAMITDGSARTIRRGRGKDHAPVPAAVPERLARPAMHPK